MRIPQVAKRNRAFSSVFALLAVVWAWAVGAQPLAAQFELPDGAGDAGICVVVPAGDGAALASLTKEGRMLVQGLALDDVQRDRTRGSILAKKAYGLASVITWPERRRLPYANNLINLLIVDADALGKDVPAAEEMHRVLAPFGKLHIRQAGKWTTTRTTRPKEMDDWGHFDCQADGNAVSRDTLVGPPRLPQWITGIQGNPFEGNPAGYAPGGGLRVTGRYAVLDVDAGLNEKGRPVHRGKLLLQCRDAFNGVPLWTLPRDEGVARRRWSLVATQDRVFTYLRAGGDLTALDVATGKTLTTFAGTAPEPVAGKKTAGLFEETTCVRVAGDTLVVSHNDRLLCFDAPTGKERWTFRCEGKHVLAPILSPIDGRVYCFVAAAKERRAFGQRWPFSTAVEAVVCVDAAGGKRIWENTDVASKKLPPDAKGRTRTRGAGQLLVVGKHLVVFGSCAIAGGESPFIASLELADGKTVHLDDQPVPISYNSSAYNALAKNGLAYFGGAFFNFWRYDPVSGKTEKVLTNSFNQRCTRLTATSRYFLFGQAAYWNDDFSGEQVCVARSGCALGNIPANGLTYFTPNACGCITQMRGFQALSPEKAPTTLEDGQRLVRGPADAPGLLAEMDRVDGLPAGTVAEEWNRHWRLAKNETEAVKTGEISIRARIHNHSLEACRGDAVLWRFLADARISSPPVVVGEAVVFGAHDGWVYALGLGDGRLNWKYLAAPHHRWWQAYGQLESTWPVYGVVMHEGKVIASAGTHVELGGGVTVVALEPESGKLVWRKNIRKAPALLPPGGKGVRIVGPSFLNSVPRIEDGKVTLGDGGRVGGAFQLGVDETEAEIQRSLSTGTARVRETPTAPNPREVER